MRRPLPCNRWVVQMVLDGKHPWNTLIEEYKRRHFRDTGRILTRPECAILNALKAEKKRRLT